MENLSKPEYYLIIKIKHEDTEQTVPLDLSMKREIDQVLDLSRKLSKAQPDMKNSKPKNQSYGCHQCGENFRTIKILTTHTLDTHGTFKCPTCQAGFLKRINFLQHLKVHS